MIKQFSLVSSLITIILSTSSFAEEFPTETKKYYFQFNTGSSYGTIPKGDFGSKNISSWTSLFGIEAGYRYNEHYRAGLSLSYRPNYTFSDETTENFVEEGVSGTDTSISKYQVKSLNIMANIYYDITTIKNITPYLNVGAGLARNSIREVDTRISNYEFAGSDTTTTIGKTSKNSFAYKIGFGAEYKLSQDFNLDIRYQYVDLGKIRARSTSNSATEKGTLRSQEILTGITYKF